MSFAHAQFSVKPSLPTGHSDFSSSSEDLPIAAFRLMSAERKTDADATPSIKLLDLSALPVLDLRSPQDFEKHRLRQSVSIPVNELGARTHELPDHDCEFVIIISAANSAASATRSLVQDSSVAT